MLIGITSLGISKGLINVKAIKNETNPIGIPAMNVATMNEKISLTMIFLIFDCLPPKASKTAFSLLLCSKMKSVEIVM